MRGYVGISSADGALSDGLLLQYLYGVSAWAPPNAQVIEFVNAGGSLSIFDAAGNPVTTIFSGAVSVSYPSWGALPGVQMTPTSIFTDTPIPTNTPVPSATLIPTNTSTATDTLTPSLSPTPSDTATSSFPTTIPTVTSPPSATRDCSGYGNPLCPTDSVTATSTSAFTCNNTPTRATNTPKPNQTVAAPTDCNTRMPTNTKTPPACKANSPTPNPLTLTPNAANCNTPTPSATRTASNTPTPSACKAKSPTPNPLTLTPNVTDCNTPTPSATRTASIIPTSTPTADPNHPRATVGLYDPSTSTFHLLDRNAANASDNVFVFQPVSGVPLLPLAGDWTGSGFDTVGLYDPASSTFYLRNANVNGDADYVFTFTASNGTALSGGTPFSGRWGSSSGHDGIGVFLSNGIFYLKNELTTGTFDNPPLIFGIPRSYPVIGDWDGSGVSGVGVFSPGGFSAAASNQAFSAASVVNFNLMPAQQGIPYEFSDNFARSPTNALPIAGNWFGWAHDGIGLFDLSTNTFSLKNELQDGAKADITFAFGQSNWTPMSGHWQVTPKPTRTPTATRTPTNTRTPTSTKTSTPTQVPVIAPPLWASSHYVVTVDTTAMQQNGCDEAANEYLRANGQPIDALVILDYGVAEQNILQPSEFGASTLLAQAPLPFYSVDLIAKASESFIQGYWYYSHGLCPAQQTLVSNPANMHLTLAMGISNASGDGLLQDIFYLDNSSPYSIINHHATDWANMIISVDTWDNLQSFNNQVTVAGAIDIEPGATKAQTTAWVDGFESATRLHANIVYYDFGTCAYGCNSSGVPSNPIKQYYADLSDLDFQWYVAFGARNARAVPEIYNSPIVNQPYGINAINWYNLSRYAAICTKITLSIPCLPKRLNKTFAVQFSGVTTQWQRCISPNAPCPGEDNPPFDNNGRRSGWGQLFDILNADPVTQIQSIEWATDFIYDKP